MKLLLIISVLTFASYTLNKETYCECFDKGFKNGYCYNQINCVAPNPPSCPTPDINETNDCRGGYARGFYVGRKARKQ